MLTLRQHVVDRMKHWAERFPLVEVTGFVASGPHGQRVQPMQNISPYPDKYYDWDPAEMLEKFNAMDRDGEEPICFYHSHPSGKHDPSETDMLGAMNVGLYYVILYPHYIHHHDDEPEWRLSAWECIDMGILVEARYEVQP